MNGKQTTLEILRNMRDKKVIEHKRKAGLCQLFENELFVYLRNVYGVYVLDVDRRLKSVFEQAAQAVLGYDLVHHAFWLLPLDEQGNYTLPVHSWEEDEDGEMSPTQMYDSVTGQSCRDVYCDEPERLTSARLKLLDDMIEYLEKELK